MSIKVLACSDAHGYLKELETELVPLLGGIGRRGPEYTDPLTGVRLEGAQPDLMVLCGDMIQDARQLPRLLNFMSNMTALFKGPIVMVPGNHERTELRLDDPLFKEVYPQLFPGAVVLLDETRRIPLPNGGEVVVAGLDWNREHTRARRTPSLGEIPASISALVEKLSPPGRGRIDILAHHIPPHGILDATRQRVAIGGAAIREIVEILKPRLSVFGHCHERMGYLQAGDTTFVNACLFPSRKGYCNVPMKPRLIELEGVPQ